MHRSCRWSVLTLLGIVVSVTAGPALAQVGDHGVESFAFPPKDSTLQAGLRAALAQPPFRTLVSRKRLSVALVDLSDTAQIRYAGVEDDRMRYAASLPKIAILLTVFDQIGQGTVEYTPDIKTKMELMIRHSSNRASTQLIKVVGFAAIAQTLRDPHYELYDPDRSGGLWIGKDYGGGFGRWRRDPMHQITHGATARQVARFFVMLDRGELVSAWASAEMKDILSKPALQHKFVRGLDARPGSSVYRKSGTWKDWHADAALVERNGKKYVAVALLESPRAGGVLSSLIVKLDDLVHRPAPTQRVGRTP